MVVSCHYCVVEKDDKRIVEVVADMMAVVVASGQRIDIADGKDCSTNWYYWAV